jgi:hypothetical protein
MALCRMVTDTLPKDERFRAEYGRSDQMRALDLPGDDRFCLAAGIMGGLLLQSGLFGCQRPADAGGSTGGERIEEAETERKALATSAKPSCVYIQQDNGGSHKAPKVAALLYRRSNSAFNFGFGAVNPSTTCFAHSKYSRFR